MIPVFLAAAALTGGCRVVVTNQAVHAAQAVQAVQYAAPVAAYAAPAYYTAAALQYRVEDPERAALVRQNEQLTTALVNELHLQRQRAERLESAIAASGDPAGIHGPQRLPLTAASLVQTNCAACHTGEKAKGGFVLSAKPNHAERLLINNVVQAGEMPPKDKRQLSTSDKRLIDDWAVVSREELKAAAKGK